MANTKSDARYLSLVPERKSIANVRNARLIAAPKSGCLRIAAWNTTMMPTGFIKDVILAVLYSGLDMYLARNMTIEIFTSSDGWKVEGQSLIHLLAPPAETPILGRKTSISSTKEKISRGIAIFFIVEGFSL